MATSTPWGKSQHSVKLAPGIMSYSTAGHGGIHLSLSRWLELPEGLCHTEFAPDQWYEEDCDWAIPYYWFRHSIRDYLNAHADHDKDARWESEHWSDNVDIALAVINRCFPDKAHLFA